MSRPILLALAPVLCGAAAPLFAFLRAPQPRALAGWAAPFIARIVRVALGFLPTLVALVSG